MKLDYDTSNVKDAVKGSLIIGLWTAAFAFIGSMAFYGISQGLKAAKN